MEISRSKLLFTNQIASIILINVSLINPIENPKKKNHLTSIVSIIEKTKNFDDERRSIENIYFKEEKSTKAIDSNFIISIQLIFPNVIRKIVETISHQNKRTKFA